MIPQIFSLDFDDTFTASPALWRLFCQMAHMAGHTVVCITARNETDANIAELKAALPDTVSFYFASCQPKREFARELGLEINVWIDDYPDAIVGEGGTIDELCNENERLRLLVEEARNQRDSARSDAMRILQKEMAELRAELARLKHRK